MFSRLKRVLVVDDSPDFIFLYKTLLTRMKVEVVTATDGLAATAMLEADRFDLIVTDFNMPYMDGVELLNWCRERSFACPVILATCEARAFSNAEIALGNCSATVLQKPFDFAAFKSALTAADHHVLA